MTENGNETDNSSGLSAGALAEMQAFINNLDGASLAQIQAIVTNQPSTITQ